MSKIGKLFDKWKKQEAPAPTVKESLKVEPTPIPPPAVTKVFQAVVMQQAPNPQWVYAKAPDVDGKLAVIIPRRLKDKLVGKRIYVEAISDAIGTTYRYVQPPQG